MFKIQPLLTSLEAEGRSQTWRDPMVLQGSCQVKTHISIRFQSCTLNSRLKRYNLNMSELYKVHAKKTDYTNQCFFLSLFKSVMENHMMTYSAAPCLGWGRTELRSMICILVKKNTPNIRANITYNMYCMYVAWTVSIQTGWQCHISLLLLPGMEDKKADMTFFILHIFSARLV